MDLSYITEEWLKKWDDADEPECGILACSPEILKAAEEISGRKWDGTQEDAERLFADYMRWPGI